MLRLLTFLVLFTITYGFPCCVVHDTLQACGAEGSGECVWLGDSHQFYVTGVSLGAKCVSDPWYQCEMGVYCPPPGSAVAPPAQVASSNCYLTPCSQSAIEYNVAFIIDESGSVGKPNYVTSLNFVENMITNNIQDNANISLMAFSSQTDRIYHFSDSQNDQRAGALAALQSERADYRGGMTCMKYALELLENEIVADPNINSDDKNILFLMTDGNPNCGGDVCDMKAPLDALGVETWVIGIGAGFDRNEVRCLVDLDTRIINIANFDTEDFYKIESQLRVTVCPIVFEEGIFAQISGLMYDYGFDSGAVSFWVFVAGFVIIALGYWHRERLCHKSGKYQPIIDREECYGATTRV